MAWRPVELARRSRRRGDGQLTPQPGTGAGRKTDCKAPKSPTPCLRSEERYPRRRAKASEPVSARNDPAIFCWTFWHAQVLLGLMVGEGDGDVVAEGRDAQHCLVLLPKALQQAACGRVLEPALLPRLAFGRRIGGQSGGEQLLVAAEERVARGLAQAPLAAGVCLRHGRFQRHEQRLPSLWPSGGAPALRRPSARA
jgi:hypothetical protein